MGWLKKTENWVGPYNGRRQKRCQRIERVYSVSEVAELLSVSKQTVFKWLSIDDPNNAVIPPQLWFKLPSGHIRIKEQAIFMLMGQNKA